MRLSHHSGTVLHAVPTLAHVTEQQGGHYVWHSLGVDTACITAPEQLCAILLLWGWVVPRGNSAAPELCCTWGLLCHSRTVLHLAAALVQCSTVLVWCSSCHMQHKPRAARSRTVLHMVPNLAAPGMQGQSVGSEPLIKPTG